MPRRVREDIDHWFDNGVDIPTRTIYLGPSKNVSEDPEIDAHNAAAAVKALHLFSRAYSPEKPITLILNSPGGCVEHGFAIYDAIRTCTCPVHIDVLGQAQSMGSIILQAGDIRRAHENAIIMLHDGSSGFNGHTRDLESVGDLSKRIRWRTYRIFAARTGRSPEYWEVRSRNDSYYFAEEALEEGLIDEIIRPD